MRGALAVENQRFGGGREHRGSRRSNKNHSHHQAQQQSISKLRDQNNLQQIHRSMLGKDIASHTKPPDHFKTIRS